jgi:hypothetical protein
MTFVKLPARMQVAPTCRLFSILKAHSLLQVALSDEEMLITA